jgi:uncharacterized membrane protein
MITVTLYTRDECRLCDETKEDLISLQEEIPHKLVEVDIDGNRDLLVAYGFDIPVVEVGPYKLKAPITQQELKMTLGAARDRAKDLRQLEGEKYEAQLERGWKVTKSDRFSYWISNHYMMVFNFFVILYLGLPFLAPFLMSAGIETPAKLIYRGYGAMCHQFAFRSWFLFGDQPAYPRAAAGSEVLESYEDTIGLDPNDQWAARKYVGEEGIGYKVGLCQRDVAIYGGILLFGVIFAVTGKKIKSIPWYVWILVGILPIALDGLSQIFSQPPLNIIPPLNLLDYRESTPFLRSLTGFLFGFTTAWFGYPLVEETMVDTRRYMATKFARVKAGEVESH